MAKLHFEDRRLVKRLLAHERAAFNEFFDGYFPRLYRFARARLGDDQEIVKEIVHVSLSKAIRSMQSYRGEAALFTWLCTICRNAIADHLEKQAREREVIVLTEDSADVQAAVDSYLAPAMEQPEATVGRLEAIRLIQVALDRLPTNYGNALEWKYVYGYSVEEIASRLGVGVEAAQSVLARAKRAFQEVYGALTDGIGGTTRDAQSGSEA